MEEDLRNIEKELESIIGKKRGKNKIEFKFLEKFFENFLDINFYYIIPIIIFIILIVIKPNFLYDNDIEKKERVFSFVKFFLYTLIFSIMTIITLYFINYKSIY
jgi:hypothetical protein